ncbi:MAG: Bifunctional NAD(P)H-hydrate repair enzyme [Verrucomicrobiaceae bacterium]|nr:Bifunctional NAD(P)H-hydrate repair enzyme [Verrucomicrobiaceae bacterium]
MSVTCSQMQEIERKAFARGVSAAALMEEAGRGMACAVRQFCPKPGLLVMYLGKGNNAGDALVAGRELQRDGWRLAARMSGEPGEMKPLPHTYWRALGTSVEVLAAVPAHRGPVVLFDGLLGIGANGPLTGVLRVLAAEMNHLRRTRHAVTVAMDIPSGLNGDTGEPAEDTVMADITITVAQVKAGLLADAALDHVGRLVVVPLPELQAEAGSAGPEAITSTLLRPALPRRSFGMHKGKAGRVAIIAGGRGFLGAGVLCSLGALRGGAGLITLVAKADAYELLAMKLPPEIMVKQVKSYEEAMEGYDAIAMGPGLGFEHEQEVVAVFRNAKQPVVVDADALTLLARHGIPSAQGPRLFTPHPGEIQRLIKDRPEWQKLGRCELAEAFAHAHPGSTVLFKGSRTVVATSGLPTRFNTTGHPGMSTGGIGDVLTGLAAALIGQGISLHDAASLGSWLVGRAAEISLRDGGRSAEALSATDIAGTLGQAFDGLREECW